MCRVAVILLFVEMVLLTEAYAQSQCPNEYTNITGHSCTYIGDCQDGLPHGSGSEECANGTTYTGDFAYGTRQGKGTAVNDGRRYEGDFKNGILDGQGTYYYADGSKYEGGFKGGIYEGRGIFVFPNGDRYEGDFKGDRYEGDFKAGAYSGKGTYYHADGSKYEGDYSEGQPNGKGTYYYADGTRYGGNFKDGIYIDAGYASLIEKVYMHELGANQDLEIAVDYEYAARELIRQSWEHISNKQFQMALNKVHSARKIGADFGDPDIEVLAGWHAAYIYSEMENYQGVRENTQSLVDNHQFPPSEQITFLAFHLEAVREVDSISVFFEEFDKALNTLEMWGDIFDIENSERDVSIFFSNIRIIDEEHENAIKLLESWRNHKIPMVRSRIYKTIGDLQIRLGYDLETVLDYDYEYAARELIRQSWEHISNKQFQTALSKVHSVRKIGADFGDPDIEVLANWQSARIYSRMKNYQAVREITQPLVDNQKFPPSNQIFYLSNHLKAVKEVDSISVFLEEFDKALSNLEMRGDIFDIENSELDVSVFFGNIRFIDGEHENAIKLLESWRNHKIPIVRSFVYKAIGDLQEQLNQRRQAYRNYSLALDDASPKRREAILNSMYVVGGSSSYINNGDQLKELSGQNKIEHLMYTVKYKSDPNKPEENESVLNELVSITSESIVDDSSALNYLIAMQLKVEFLENKYSNSDKSSEQKIPIDIHKEAFSKFDQDLFKTPNDQVKYIQLLELREDAYWQLEQFDKAIEIALAVLKRGSQEYGKDNTLLLPVLSRLSFYYGLASRKEEYRGIFDRAISIQLKWLKLGFCEHLNFAPAHALAALGPDELEKYLAQVIDVHVGLSASYSSLEDIYPCSFAAGGLLYAYSYLIESGSADNSKAFQLVQIIRLNRLSSSINLGASKAIMELPELQALAKQYASLSLQLEAELDYDNEPDSGLVTDYRRIEAERDLIADQLKDGLPQLGRGMSAIPATISEVSRKLQPDEAVVLYYRVPNDLVLAWVISAEDNHLIPISSQYEEVKQNVEVIRSTLEQDGISTILDIKPFALNEAYSLYKTFFEPLEKYLQGYNKVFLVPHDELSTIPFEILPTELPVNPVDSVTDFYLYDDINWLNDKYQFIYPPSIISILSQSRAVERKSHRYIGVGNPVMNADSPEGNVTRVHSDLTMMGYTSVSPIPSLPNLPQTEQQLRALASQFDVKPDFLLGSDATETMVREMLSPEYSVIAFATHGLLGSNISLEPALVLSPPVEFSSLDDGLLTASEISELDLAADVVLLSACNTATPTNARGLNNLAYSFLYAGAHSVIASHWSIEVNATTELLNRFAHHLSEGSGLSVSAAMKHARRDIKKNSRNIVFSHPLFWGPFTIKGLSETYPNAKIFPE